VSVRVFLLGGSLAEPSHTSALLCAAERALAVQGASVERWDVAERPLPMADPAQHSLPVARRRDPGRALVRAADSAHSIVLASPLYHNSYSGALKNALDHLSACEFHGKPVALISHSGRFLNAQAADHLRLVVRGLLGLAIPQQVITVDGDWELENSAYYRLVASAIDTRLDEMADSLLALAARLGPSGFSTNGFGRSRRPLPARTQ
jgi:azobenzene reductase